MANSADPNEWRCFSVTQLPGSFKNLVSHPDQLASEANWSGSSLFAKAWHIQAQQDKG